jgi:hypothetical protein
VKPGMRLHEIAGVPLYELSGETARADNTSLRPSLCSEVAPRSAAVVPLPPLQSIPTSSSNITPVTPSCHVSSLFPQLRSHSSSPHSSTSSSNFVSPELPRDSAVSNFVATGAHIAPNAEELQVGALDSDSNHTKVQQGLKPLRTVEKDGNTVPLPAVLTLHYDPADQYRHSVVPDSTQEAVLMGVSAATIDEAQSQHKSRRAVTDRGNGQFLFPSNSQRGKPQFISSGRSHSSASSPAAAHIPRLALPRTLPPLQQPTHESVPHHWRLQKEAMVMQEEAQPQAKWIKRHSSADRGVSERGDESIQSIAFGPEPLRPTRTLAALSAPHVKRAFAPDSMAVAGPYDETNVEAFSDGGDQMHPARVEVPGEVEASRMVAACVPRLP